MMMNSRNHWFEVIHQGHSIFECNDLYITIEQIAISYDGRDCILIMDGETMDDDYLQGLVSLFRRGQISEQLDSQRLEVTNFYFSDNLEHRVV